MLDLNQEPNPDWRFDWISLIMFLLIFLLTLSLLGLTYLFIITLYR